MTFAKTIEYVEAQADEVSSRFPEHWAVTKRRHWIATQLISMHHWQALEEYLAREETA